MVTAYIVLIIFRQNFLIILSEATRCYFITILRPFMM